MEEICKDSPASGLDVVSYDGGNYIRAVEHGECCGRLSMQPQ
jgi:hypothetical protein